MSVTTRLLTSKRRAIGVKDATVSWIEGVTGEELNSFDSPRHVAIRTRALRVDADVFTVDLPPWSVSMFSMDAEQKLVV